MRKKPSSFHIFNKYLQFDFLVYVLVILFAVVGSVVSVVRFWQYDVYYYDFGIFDQALFRASRFQPPIIEHMVVGGKWIFADHLNPSLFILSPLFWITDRSEVLLIAQAVIVALSGYVIYLIGKKLLHNNLLSLSVTICYLFFVGLQNAVISDIHEVTIMVLPLTLVYYSFVKNNVKLFFLFLLFTLGFKESTFLLGVGIGISVIMLNKSWRGYGIFTILLSILWGFLSIKLIIPYFSDGRYQYSADIHLGIEKIVASFINHPMKLHTLFFSFFSFGFLPLFSPSFYFLIFQDFLMRFLPAYAYTRWNLGLHYSAQLAPLLAISSLYGLTFLMKMNFVQKYYRYLVIILILNSLVLFRFVLNGPFNLIHNKVFYQDIGKFSFLDTIIKKVPKDATVMAQNNHAVRFTHNPDVWLLRKDYQGYMPDYILLDTRDGQSLNNFLWTGDSVEDIAEIVRTIKDDTSHYKLIYSTREQFLFKKQELQ